MKLLACLSLCWALLLTGGLASAAGDLLIDPRGWASMDGRTFPCSLGRSGVREDKREGDGATPAGAFSLGPVFYRPDRVSPPQVAGLPLQALTPQDGWCDDPVSPQYNRWVKLPFAASHEELWRDDHVYDIIVVVGYNDHPVVPGKGSAIFLHLARPGFTPTAGCLAFSHEDLLYILARLDQDSRVIIPPPQGHSSAPKP